MPSFENLFGLKETQIQKTCIFSPLMTKGLLEEFNITKLEKGNPFSSANTKNCTFIYTKIGAPFVGDAVLYLKDTPCENIILFGSCGLVKKTSDLNIGALVTPTQSYEMESFSQLLNNIKNEYTPAKSNEEFLTSFKNYTKDKNIYEVVCSTFGSLALEIKYFDCLIDKGIDIVDMECSSFFNAAKFIKQKAIALFYVTDILGEKNVFDPISQKEKILIDNAINRGAEIIKEFISTY